MFFVLFLLNRMRGWWWRTAMLAIDTQPARDKRIDILNRVWFDLLLLSRWSFWGRVDWFCPGLQRPGWLTSLVRDLPISQLVHVNSELIPHVQKWKTDADFFREQSHLLCSVSPRLCGVGLLIDCSLWFHVCPGGCCSLPWLYPPLPPPPPPGSDVWNGPVLVSSCPDVSALLICWGVLDLLSGLEWIIVFNLKKKIQL